MPVTEQEQQAWVEGGVEQQYSHDQVLSGFHGELWAGMDLQSCPKMGFPDGAVVENLPANTGDTGSSPGLGRSYMLCSD